MAEIKRELLKGVYYTAFAKYAGILVSLVVTGILARLISPEDFGIVAIATILIQFFSTISSLGIGPAIVQHKDLTKQDISHIFSFTVLIGFLIFIIFFILSWPISSYYDNKSLLIISQILSLSLFFNTINTVPNFLLYKEKQFKFITYRTLSVQIIGGTASVIAALSGLGLYALIINPIFSSIVLFIINFRKYPQKFSFSIKKGPIKQIFSFSIYLFLFDIINYLSRNLDKLIIGRSLGLSSLGFYEKSYRLMMLPLQNISHVVGPVIHPVFSEYQGNLKELVVSYEKLIRFMSLIGFPLSVLLYFTAKELTLLIFGPMWMPSVASFEILSFSVGIQIVLSTSGAIFQSTNSTKQLFFAGLLSTGLTVAGMFLAAIFFKTIEAVAWSITITFSINFIQTYLILYLSVFKRNIYSLLKQFVSPLIITLVLLLNNLLLVWLVQIDSLILSLIIKGTLSVFIFLLYIQISGEYNIIERLKSILKKSV